MAGILDQLMAAGGGAGAAGAPVDVPQEIPDPEPHLAPGDEEASEPAPQDEVGLLKQLITLGRQYTEISTVEESERLEMEKATTIFQKLLASNEKMSDQVTGANPATRKVLGAGG